MHLIDFLPGKQICYNIKKNTYTSSLLGVKFEDESFFERQHKDI